LIGITLKEVEDESQLGTVVVVGTITNVEDRLALEDKFFCFGLVSFELILGSLMDRGVEAI
jgi:hypothetical protein